MNNNSKPKALGVKQNFIFNVTIQLLTYLIPLITAPYLSRVLTPTGIGNNSFVNSITSYFTMIIAFGYTTYGTKEIAENQRDKETYSKVFWNVTFARGFLFAICFVAYFLMAYLWGFGGVVDKRVFLVYSLLLLNAFLDITYFFQGLENFRILAILHIVFRIIAAICYFLFVKTADDLLLYVIIMTISTLAVTLVSWMIALRWIDKLHFKDIHVLKSLKENLRFFLPTIAISVYTVLDRTMLGYLTTQEQVGFYEEAYKIIAIGTGIMNAISPIMLSRISALIKANKEDEVREKEIQLAEIYFVMGFPMVAGLYSIGRYFIPAFFGEEYMASVYVLYWLIPLIMVIPISNIVGNVYYVPRGKISKTTVFFIIGALLNFGANFLSIGFLGASGAAITSLLAETVISTLFIVFSWKAMPYKEMAKTMVKPLIATATMTAILLVLDLLVLNRYVINNLYITLISVLVGVMTYGIMLVLLRETMVMRTLKKIFHRFKR